MVWLNMIFYEDIFYVGVDAVDHVLTKMAAAYAVKLKTI